MHRGAVSVAPHKNPIRLFAFGGGRQEIWPLIMLSQYSADFVVAITPVYNSEKLKTLLFSFEEDHRQLMILQ